MRRQEQKYPTPQADLRLDNKLKCIAKAFKENLTKVAKVATNGKGKAKEYAAEQTSKMPKKHVIATTLALCEEELSKLLGTLYWRCSMSEHRETGKPVIKRVKTILAAVDEKPLESYDEWPPIEEFMHDFSASTHTIPRVTGKEKGYRCKSGNGFRLLFAAESEMNNGGLEARSHAITRDLVKLCLVECPIKVVIYRRYCDVDKGDSIVKSIVRTIRRCPSPGKRNEGWLLIGLTGTWPGKVKLHFHTIKVGATKAVPHDW